MRAQAANPLMILLVVVSLVGQEGVARERADLELVRETRVESPPPTLPILRVGGNGSLYLLDRATGRLTGFAPNGARMRLPGADEAGAVIVQFDLDGEGSLRLVTAAGEVAALDAHGESIDRSVPRFDTPGRGLGAIVADGEGRYYLLASGGESAIHHFDARGTLVRSFGAPPGGEPARKSRSPRGWLRRGPDGTIYYRPESELVFYRFSPEGLPLATIRPVGVPYRPTASASDPGDNVFGTDLLSDGRIIFEIVHRTPYQASAAAPDGRAALTTSLDVKLYVVTPGGEARALSPPSSKQLGEFAAVGPDDALYFVKTAHMLQPGEGTTIQKLRLRVN